MDDNYDVPLAEAPSDIDNFCMMLRDAWKLIPDSSFPSFLEEVFNGYNLNDLTTEEQEEYLRSFILNNI